MEQTALILIIVTLFLLVVIVGVLTFLLFKLFGQDKSFINPAPAETGEGPHPDISKSEFHPDILERIKGMEKVKPKRAHLFQITQKSQVKQCVQFVTNFIVGHVSSHLKVSTFVKSIYHLL